MFIEICQAAIADHKAGNVPFNEAATKISAGSFEYPLDGSAHPMLYKIADLAFDITEDYRSEAEDKADWDKLTKTLEKYLAGDWEPTCWILSVMYAEYAQDKVDHSYSVCIRRQNGKTLAETAHKEIGETIDSVLKNVSNKQTDERYLENLALIIPQVIDQFSLASVELREHLTEPY